MKEDLLKIINHYGVLPQLKYFQSEVFELNEAIIRYEEAGFNYYEAYDYKEIEELEAHITEEIADCLVMLEQFIEYYNIGRFDIAKTMEYKVNRQLDRIKGESNE